MSNGISQQAAVAGGHVASVEVEAYQANAGIHDGACQGIEILVGRDRFIERPPHLDGVVTGRGGGGAVTSGSTGLLVLSALVAGAGGGAFYPLFASLAREYFGERSAMETHGVVYSAKAFGGVLGVGLAALATQAWGFGAVFLVAGAVALGSAALCQRLRQPGRTPVLPHPHLAG